MFIHVFFSARLAAVVSNGKRVDQDGPQSTYPVLEGLCSKQTRLEDSMFLLKGRTVQAII